MFSMSGFNISDSAFAFRIQGVSTKVVLSNGVIGGTVNRTTRTSTGSERAASVYVFNGAWLNMMNVSFNNYGTALTCDSVATVRAMDVTISYTGGWALPDSAVVFLSDCNSIFDGLLVKNMRFSPQRSVDNILVVRSLNDTFRDVRTVISRSIFDDISGGGGTAAVVGVYESCVLRISDTMFHRTVSALQVRAKASVTLSNVSIVSASEITNGTVSIVGTGAALTAENIVIDNCTAEHNGGGFLVDNGAQLNIVGNVTIQNSQAVQGHGGAIFASNNTLIAFSHDDDSYLDIRNCHAVLGGGISFERNSSVTFNVNRNSSLPPPLINIAGCGAMVGGAIYVDAFLEKEIVDNVGKVVTMVNNTAVCYGNNTAAPVRPRLRGKHPNGVLPGQDYSYPFCVSAESIDGGPIDTKLCNFSLTSDVGTVFLTNTLAAVTSSTSLHMDPCVSLSFFLPEHATEVTLSITGTCANVSTKNDNRETFNISRCPSMFEWSSGSCRVCTVGRYSVGGRSCRPCPHGVRCDAERALPNYPNVSLTNVSDGAAWLIPAAIHSEEGYWWRLNNSTGDIDVWLCPFGLCGSDNKCGDEHRDWNSTMCTRCIGGTTAWGRQCHACSKWNYISIIVRVICVLVFVAVVHHSSSGNSAAVRIFMHQLEVVALITELRAFLNLSDDPDNAILYNTVNIMSNAVSQGIAIMSCVGPLSSFLTLMYQWSTWSP
eukprot:PhM_4_TR1336/c2_g1_i8/m.48746